MQSNEFNPTGILIDAVTSRDTMDYMKSIGSSAHYYVYANGAVEKEIKLPYKANHQGIDMYPNININDYMISIMLVVDVSRYSIDTETAFSTEFYKNDWFMSSQLDSLASLCLNLMSTYDFDTKAVVTHRSFSNTHFPRDIFYKYITYPNEIYSLRQKQSIWSNLSQTNDSI